MNPKFPSVETIFLACGLFLTGCASHQPVSQPVSYEDPWQDWNRSVQSFNDTIDEYAMQPVAKGYRWVMPGFADRAVSNFFSNIDDIGVTINDVLQGKLQQSGLDASRFLINTTAGIAGFIDVAVMLDLPKHREDFDQTLGFWGVPSGPYLVLPFFGPSTPRGVAGLMGDAAMNPISYVGPYISGGLFAINAVDMRADNLGTERIANEAAAFGRYEFFRDTYLNQRRYLILDGNVPDEDVLDMDDNENSAPINPY
jgi:phospholipid-binding lipoprotein MlaA